MPLGREKIWLAGCLESEPSAALLRGLKAVAICMCWGRGVTFAAECVAEGRCGPSPFF